MGKKGDLSDLEWLLVLDGQTFVCIHKYTLDKILNATLVFAPIFHELKSKI